MKNHVDALEVTVADEIGPISGEAEYVATDLSLRYRPPNEMEARAALSRSGHWRQTGQGMYVIAGFLTLRFEGAPLVLTSLDAYTNRDQWQHVSLDQPAPCVRGALLLVDRSEEADDERVSMSEQPVYEIDETQRALRIRLTSEGPPSFFAEVGRNLFAGINEGRLMQLVLFNVKLR